MSDVDLILYIIYIKYIVYLFQCNFSLICACLICMSSKHSNIVLTKDNQMKVTLIFHPHRP